LKQTRRVVQFVSQGQRINSNLE